MRFQLFCFPHAGGKRDSFEKLKTYLSDEIELACIEYAGHGTRYNEKLIDKWEVFLEDVAAQITRVRLDDFTPIFLGYSMGSIVGYELIIRRLISFKPCYFIALSHEAPNLEWKSKQYYKLDDNRFIQKMMEFGGIDSKLAANIRFLKLFTRPLRNDYYLLGMYQARKEKLDCPIHIFYSPQDVSIKGIREWRKFTNKNFEMTALEGNHFLLNNFSKEVADNIIEVCRSISV